MCICPFCNAAFKADEILFQRVISENPEGQSAAGSAVSQGATGGAAMVYGLRREDIEYERFIQKFQHATNFKKTHIVYRVMPRDGRIPEADEVAPRADDARGGDRGDTTPNLYGMEQDISNQPPAKTTDPRHAYGEVLRWEDEGQTIPLALRPCDGTGVCTERICPRCHCEIPLGYLTLRQEHIKHIGLIGGTGAGKTQYMVAMMQDINRWLDAELRLASARIEKETMRFFNILSEQLRNDGRTAATQTDKPLFPMMLTITPRDENNRTILIFYDIPGEYANNVGIAFGSALETADTLLYIVDPLQIAQIRRELGQEIIRAYNAGGYGENSLSDPLRLLREYKVCRGIKRLAVIMTKTDLLIRRHNEMANGSGMLGVNHRIYRYTTLGQHKDSVNISELEQISNNVRYHIEGDNYIYTETNNIATLVSDTAREEYDERRREFKRRAEEYQKMNRRKQRRIIPTPPLTEDEIEQALNEEQIDFPVQYFAVSTHQWTPDPNGQAFIIDECRVANCTRHRIVEPILYLLSVWDIVPHRWEG